MATRQETPRRSPSPGAAFLLAGALAAPAWSQVLPPEPVARNDRYELTAPTMSVAAPGMLANDFGTGIFASNFGAPDFGTVSVVTDGSFQYTAPSGFDGVARFDYLIRDQFGRVADAKVEIDASTSVPRPRDDYYTLNALTLSVSAPGLLANDSGGLGSLIASNFSNPTDGTLSVVTDGSFVWTPSNGFAGVAEFTYSVRDGLDRFRQAKVFMDAAASIPVAFPDSFSMLANTTLNIAAPGLLANDVGGIGNVIASNFFPPAIGSISVVTDGSFVYTPPAGFTGVATFDYITRDELGRFSGAATVSIAVVPEPGTWALLLLGLAGVGRVAQRRSARAAV